jgi:hypothetical protein
LKGMYDLVVYYIIQDIKMECYSTLLDYIQSLKIIDTHEHIPLESARPQNTDVLSEWLTHYFSCDLISAGMTDGELAAVKDCSKDINERWKIAEPYWHAAEFTGYGRSLSIAARDIYGINQINKDTIEELNHLFLEARKRGGHYDFVLKNKSRIAFLIRDSILEPYSDSEDLFVYTFHTNEFICPTHYFNMYKRGIEVGVEIHTLSDWMEVTRRQIEKYVNGSTRIVCLKNNLAYMRSLRFDKVTQADAEKAFNEFFYDSNLPDWRQPIKAAKTLADWMMHFVCRVADENRLVYQIHTGLQEGNGNIIYDSNPVLLSNLFIEYQNARFDIFHMGYPYVMELGSLAKNFRNVFISA